KRGKMIRIGEGVVAALFLLSGCASLESAAKGAGVSVPQAPGEASGHGGGGSASASALNVPGVGHSVMNERRIRMAPFGWVNPGDAVLEEGHLYFTAYAAGVDIMSGEVKQGSGSRGGSEWEPLPNYPVFARLVGPGQSGDQKVFLPLDAMQQ